jgi:hypothetical protein
MKFKSEVQLEALNNATVDTDKFLVSDSSTVKYRTGAEVLSDIGGQTALTNPITGTGTLNFVSKFTSTGSTLGDSQIFDNGSAVGIGTTSPSTKLEVNSGTSTGPTLRLATTGISVASNTLIGEIDFYNSDATTPGARSASYIQSFSAGTAGGGDLRFGVSANAATVSEAMRIASTRNVGIGTTVPDTLLHISSLNSSILRLESTNTALGLDAVVGEIQFEANDASGSGTGVKAKIGAYSDVAAGNAVGLRFFTGDAGFTTGTEKMRISASGNVGIGTTVPATNLEVYANTATLRISDSKNASAIGEKSSSLEFWSIDGSVASGVSGARVRASINTVFDTTTGSLNSLVFNVNDGTKDALPERMRITSSGNVGIKTTSPSETLHVNGNLKIADGSTTKLHITDTILNGIIEYNGFMIDNTKTHFGIDVGSSVMIGVKADTHAYFINSSQEVFGLNGSESGLIASNALMQGSPGDPTTITNWIQIKDENGNKFYLPLYQ